MNAISFKKSSLVHIAPAYTGSEKGSDHFESYVRSISSFLHEAVWLWKISIDGTFIQIGNAAGCHCN
jgi:hypothetical protein